MTNSTQIEKTNDRKELRSIINEPDFKTASAEWKRLYGDETKLVIKQGEILNRISTLYGKQGFIAFCKGNNISESKAYEIIVIYQYRDHELSDVIMGLTHRKAFTFARLIKQVAASDDESVTFTDGTSVSRDEIKKMSCSELDALASAKKQYERLAKSNGENHEKEINKYKNQLKTAREDYDKLKTALDKYGATVDDAFLGAAIRSYHEFIDLLSFTFREGSNLDDIAVKKRNKLILELADFTNSVIETNDDFMDAWKENKAMSETGANESPHESEEAENQG